MKINISYPAISPVTYFSGWQEIRGNYPLPVPLYLDSSIPEPAILLYILTIAALISSSSWSNSCRIFTVFLIPLFYINISTISIKAWHILSSPFNSSIMCPFAPIFTTKTESVNSLSIFPVSRLCRPAGPGYLLSLTAPTMP